MFDVFDLASQLAVGQQLLNLPQQARPVIVGSSGVEYALARALTENGRIAGRADFAPLKADRVIAISGSVSPTTERQIRYALNHGFTGIPVDPLSMATGDTMQTVAGLVEQSVDAIRSGSSVLVYTALGHTTDISQALAVIPDARSKLGQAMGQLLKQVIERTGVCRTIISGGDTSGHALQQLGIHALTLRYPLKATPGSPVCLAHSGDKNFNRMEIAMKGGQIGADDYFVSLRDAMSPVRNPPGLRP